MSGFRRYTNLAAAIHLLHTRKITLLNPGTWDDKNDAYFMAEYKRHKGAKTVLALCFAEREETYHHWRVFSPGSDGVCIEFDKTNLLSTFEKDNRVKQGYVNYKFINDISAMTSVDVEELPFLKRNPYGDESEYRVICVDIEEAKEYEDYEFDLEWINRITLSPWIAPQLAKSVKTAIRSIEGCSHVKVVRSTLIENETWKKLTTRVRKSTA